MSAEGGSGRTLTVMLVPDGGVGTRSYGISYRALRIFAVLGSLGVLFLLAMAGTWWYMAAQAARVPGLTERVAELEEERVQVRRLARQLEALEGEYGRIRRLFGAGLAPEAGRVWLPPAAGAVRAGGDVDPPEATRPTSWPLTVRGFLTRPLLEGAEGGHPGIDIAVPAESYVRAAGAGTVVDVGEDPVYGRYVLLEHADGYRSLYGHASETLVEIGRRVERNEVIALSGSTGRSTAPHLHFEILKDGEPVDPLELVRQP